MMFHVIIPELIFFIINDHFGRFVIDSHISPGSTRKLVDTLNFVTLKWVSCSSHYKKTAGCRRYQALQWSEFIAAIYRLFLTAIQCDSQWINLKNFESEPMTYCHDLGGVKKRFQWKTIFKSIVLPLATIHWLPFTTSIITKNSLVKSRELWFVS